MMPAEEAGGSREARGRPHKGKRSTRRGHTNIQERAGKLLKTSLGVWVAAAIVNVATLLANHARGLLVALPVAAVTLAVASVVVWAVGRLEIGRRGVAIRRSHVSPRRIAAVALGVLVASVATAVVIWVATIVIAALEAPPDPRAVLGT